MKLSRGAQRCLKLLRWYSARFSDVHPSQSKIAKHLEVTDRQVRRYLAELVRAGFLKVRKAGPYEASYLLLAKKNVRSMSGQRPVFGDASINTSISASEKQQQAAAILEHFGNAKINGVGCSEAIVSRVVEIVGPEGVEAFKALSTRWWGKNKAHSWGIMLELAGDVARSQRKPPGRESTERAQEAHA